MRLRLASRLESGDFLVLDLPSGRHTCRLHYRGPDEKKLRLVVYLRSGARYEFQALPDDLIELSDADRWPSNGGQT